MTQKVIELWEEGASRADARGEPERTRADGFVTNVTRPTLTWWAPPASAANGTGVIICPGGGYEFLAVEHEGAELAHWLNTLGIAAFVLKYRVPHSGHPAPLEDVQGAIRLVRSRASEFGVEPDKVGALGSSAGGHLAACVGTLFNQEINGCGDGATSDQVSVRPDFLVLLYPVICLSGPYAHIGSRERLLGKTPSETLLNRLSPDRQVTTRTPPTFLVHALDDTVVPAENSRLFHAALQQAGVPSELRLFEEGFHGFGLGARLGDVSEWPQRCEQWLRAHGWLSRSRSSSQNTAPTATAF
jgi:acetyl esterase/lipase